MFVQNSEQFAYAINGYSQITIAKRIYEQRNKPRPPRYPKGYSQEKFSELLGVSRGTFIKWEKPGGVIPPLDYLLKMCNIFGCEVGYLLGEFDCTTREAMDIHAVTGLSERAIEILSSTDEPYIDRVSVFVNTVLEHVDFPSLLYAFFAFSEYRLFWNDPDGEYMRLIEAYENTTTSHIDSHITHNILGDEHAEDYLLFNLQKEIVLLCESLKNKQDTGKKSKKGDA